MQSIRNRVRQGCFALVLALWGGGVGAGDGHVMPLDLLKHVQGDAALHLKRLEGGVIEWTLPQGKYETLLFDLEDCGIDPTRYDEIRFEIQSTVSQVRTHWVLHGHLDPGQVSSWYLKFKTPTGVWREGRYSLHLDDDGVYLSKGKNPEGFQRWLKITLGPRILGYPGEPKERRALIRNVRFVRHRVAADFRLAEVEQVSNSAEAASIYKLRLRNQTEEEQTVRLDPDVAGRLHHFRADAPESVTLAAGETQVVPVRIAIPRTSAMARAPLYAEPAFVEVRVPGVPDGDVLPLRGYRRWPMWGVVPIYSYHTWTHAEFAAWLGARAKAMPGAAAWSEGVVQKAEGALKHDWPIPDFGPAAHNLSYRCAKCKNWLKPATPTSLHKHVCPTCKRVFDHDEHMDRAYLLNYNSARAGNVQSLALAWLITGEEKYAAKAKRLLEKYAAGRPHMPNHGTRSTSAGARLALNTLHASYVIPVFAQGYYYLRAAPVLDESSRRAIEAFLRDAGETVVQHSVEYGNQQSEHLRAYGTVGLATGFWPLAAEAIHGEFGFHEVVEYGFSEDGIAPEAGAYHRASFGALNHLAEFAHPLGVNLYTPRFQRVFDGSLASGLASGSYELAYRVYRSPAYLRRLPARDAKRLARATVLHGVIGLPDVEAMPIRSLHMEGAGYVFLRRGNAADYREIRLNYIKQFDRTEQDRFTTFFFRNGRQVDGTVGRIGYASPHSHWMYHTAAHNCIVVDGAKETGSRGRLLAFNDAAEAPVAVVASDPERPLYDGVAQLRCIALLGDAYIVFDRVVCDAPRTIDRYQYGKGKAQLKVDSAQPVDGSLPATPEAGGFQNLHGGACGETLRIDFTGGLKMRLISDGPMEAYRAVTYGGYQARPMEVTFARRAAADSATFLAAFTVGDEAQPPELALVRTDPDDLAFEVRSQEATHVVRIRPGSGAVEVRAK